MYKNLMQKDEVELTGNAIAIVDFGMVEKVVSFDIKCECNLYSEWQSNEYGLWQVGEYDWEEKDIQLDMYNGYYTIFNADGTTEESNKPFKKIIKYLEINWRDVDV